MTISGVLPDNSTNGRYVGVRGGLAKVHLISDLIRLKCQTLFPQDYKMLKESSLEERAKKAHEEKTV